MPGYTSPLTLNQKQVEIKINLPLSSKAWLADRKKLIYYNVEYIIQNDIEVKDKKRKPCLISCTRSIKFADRSMSFDLLNTLLLNFFTDLYLKRGK